MKGHSLLHKSKEYFTSNMRRSWVISYLIILLLPLVINMFMYFNAYSTIKQQAQESQKLAVERLRSNMDNEFGRIEDAVSVLSYDTNLNYLLNCQGLESFQQNYATASRLFELNETLGLLMTSGGMISDYYIFSPQNSLVFHNSGVNDIELYGELSSNYSKALYKECERLDTQMTQLFSFEPEPGVSYVAVVYPLPYSYLPKGYIAVLMDNEALDNAMQSIYSQEHSQIYLVDENFAALSGKEHLENADAFSGYDFAGGSVLDKLPGENGKSLMYSSESRVLPLYYICTLPESIATADLIYMRRSLLISALFCILGGGFLISVLSQYNYSPWQKLVNAIEGLSKSAVDKGTNEYQIVLNALTDTYQEKATIEEVLNRQNRTLYSYYLTRMLKGRMGAENMEEEILANMEKQLRLANYTVLISLIDVKDNWSSGHAELVKDAYLSFFEKQIVQKLQNSLGDSFAIAFVEVYDYTACVISMEETEADTWQVKIADAMNVIIRDLAENLDVQYYFSFSGLHHNISELSEAWEEAFASLSLCVMNQDKALTFHEDMEFSDMGSYVYPAKTEQMLINLIRIGQSEEAAALIRSLLDDIAEHFPVFETAKCAAADILSSVTKAFTLLPDSDREKIQGQYYSGVEGFMQSNSYKKLSVRLLNAAVLIAETFKEMKDMPTPQSAWVPKIEEQLRANLFDENLNVTFLAHKLGVSSKYLSSIYLEATGTSIMDTIHKRRIEKFRELICDENMNISDAAAAVGYNSIATLNRWVKKYEGVTPGQLKSLKKHD